MIHKLLKRQIRKYLRTSSGTTIPELVSSMGKEVDFNDPAFLTEFLRVVNDSYLDNDRMMEFWTSTLATSNQELSEANEHLRRESERQEQILNSLRTVARTLLDPDSTDTADELGTDVSLSDALLEDASLERLAQALPEIVRANKESQVELKKARDDAQKANRAKSEFVATISHEIRTPLNAIVGAAELLRNSSISSGQEDLIALLERSTGKLLDQINEVLDFSRIESGKLDLEESPFNLFDFLNEVMSLFKISAAEKNLNLQWTLAESAFPEIIGDEKRLGQILINLIGNAIKFTDSGSVKLFVEKVEDWNEIQTLKFSVRDTGPGISNENLERLFQPFTQMDSSITREYGGSGLGLAICKKLVYLMQGDIYVESEMGQGSVFTFTARFVRNVRGRSPAVGESAPGPGSRQDRGSIFPRDVSLLVVEDNNDNFFLFNSYFQNTNARITGASNGQLAVERVREETFDLVLMDVQMPVMDGLTATRAIRSWEHQNQRKPMPILALSAHASAQDRTASLEAGCDAHLTKPIRKKELIDAVQRFLQRSVP